MPVPAQYGTNPYDVNPYQGGYAGYSPYGFVAQQHPKATTAMVLGIVGVVFCPPVGIAGLVIGNRTRKEIDADPQSYTGRGMATAGYVLGIISVVLTVLYTLLLIVGVIGAATT